MQNIYFNFYYFPLPLTYNIFTSIFPPRPTLSPAIPERALVVGSLDDASVLRQRVEPKDWGGLATKKLNLPLWYTT